MANANVKEFTDENWKTEVLDSKVPVLVDFWAEWCGPCRMLAPTIEKLADDYAGKVKVGKLDCEAARETAMKYGITSIPTVLIFKHGQVINRLVGLKREQEFKAALEGV